MSIELTAAQKGKYQFYIDKWIKIGLSTEKADRNRAEIAIKNLYSLAELETPRIYWLEDPIQGSLAAMGFVLSLFNLKDKKNPTAQQIKKEVNKSLQKLVKDYPQTDLIESVIINSVTDMLNSKVDLEFDNDINSTVKSAGLSYIGGSLWAGWAAWNDFINIEADVTIDRSYLDLVECCGYYYCLNGIVFATEKPASINLDEQGRLHNLTGKAISYASGWGLYYVHGVKVPEYIIETPENITSALIDAENNIEVRRCMLDIFGAERYLQEGNYELLNSDVDSKGATRDLLRKQNGQDEPIVRVKVINSSPEPDGTFKPYFLKVDFELRPLLKDPDDKAVDMSRDELIRNGYLGDPQEMTCHNAVASTFGKYKHQYGIDGQTRQGDVLVTMFSGDSTSLKFRES